MLSAIVVNYHCATDTLGSVQSLLADVADLDIVVVDNSEDEQEAERLRAGLGKQVRLLVNAKNVGFGEACNLGFAATESAYVMLLNPDARAVKGCLGYLRSALECEPQLGAVSPYQWWEPRGEWLLPPAWLPTGVEMFCQAFAVRRPHSAYALSMAYRRLALRAWRSGSAVLRQRALSGGAMMVRRSAVLDVGGLFDPAFFMYYEDSDLCWRLRRAGWDLGLAGEARVVHEWVNSSNKIELMETAKEVYLKKHFRGTGRWEMRLENCLRVPATPYPLPFIDLTTLPVQLNVPKTWRENWLLEVSPSPLLTPAIGRLGRGAWAELPETLLRRLGTGPVFLRLGPATPFAEPEDMVVYRLNTNP